MSEVRSVPSVQSPLKGEWIAEVIAPAPEGVPLETRIFDNSGERNVQTLMKKGRLWWFPDMSMYVYYTPTHWRMS